MIDLVSSRYAYSSGGRVAFVRRDPVLITLLYGETGLDVEFPDDLTTVVEPTYATEADNPRGVLAKAMSTPIDSPRLFDIARAGQKVAISICDVTRPQPRPLVLEAILGELQEIDSDDIVILIATGTHRGNTSAELIEMLGSDIQSRYEIVNHDARDENSLADLGRINDVEVRLNRRWFEADLRITTGVVEPHFFAGFSGGPKMVVPGLAGIDTVMTLHDAQRIGSPNATWGIINGNPVQDDIRAIAAYSGVDFTLDVTLGANHGLSGAFAGSLLPVHERACASARESSMQAIDEPFDVVVTSNSGYPLDQNLYQAVKGISAAAQIVRDGGTIICAAECRDGIPDHGDYASIMSNRNSPRELLEMIGEPGFARPDQWQVQIQSDILNRATVQFKSSNLTDEQISGAHFEPIDSISAAVDTAICRYGKNARICVLPDGPRTVPYLAQRR